MAAPYTRALAYIYATKSRKNLNNLLRKIWPNVNGINDIEAHNALNKLGVIPGSIKSKHPSPHDLALFLSFYGFKNLHNKWDELKEGLLADHDARFMIETMELAGFPREEIYGHLKYDQEDIEIYLDSFFNIEYLKKSEILSYINRLRHDAHRKIMMEALAPQSIEYLRFVLGIRSEKLSEEKVVEELYQGFFLAAKQCMITGDIDKAVKIAGVILKAAKISKEFKSSSKAATEELLHALKNISYTPKEEEELFISKEDIEMPPSLIDGQDVQNGDKIDE